MPRLIRTFAVAAGLVYVTGCSSSESTLPAVPTTDNRPAEVKEADDLMLKNNAKVNASAKR